MTSIDDIYAELTKISGSLADLGKRVRALEVTGNPDDGWVKFHDDLVYASATSFKIEGVNLVNKFCSGTKFKLTDGTIKYFISTNAALSGSDTVVTVTGGFNYSLSGGSISYPYYSCVDNPEGWPEDMRWKSLRQIGNVDPPPPVPGSLDITNELQAVVRHTVYGNGATDKPYFQLMRAKGTKASPSAVQAGDELGSIHWRGWSDPVGHDHSGFSPGACIQANAQGNFSATDWYTTLYFQTNHSGDAFLTNDMIMVNGNIYTAEPYWIPTFVNLTVVGTPTYTGYCTKFGKWIEITAIISATTSISSPGDAGPCYIDNLPYIVSFSRVVDVGGDGSADHGHGLFASGSYYCFLPAFTVGANVKVMISGRYKTT